MIDFQQQIQQAWDTLMGIDKRYYIATGFYALGDAYLLSGKNTQYKSKIVLVEHRQKTQINHWNWLADKSQCLQQPTITTNGDDGNGNLNRKAPCLKVLT